MPLRKWAAYILILTFTGLAVFACDKAATEKQEPTKNTTVPEPPVENEAERTAALQTGAIGAIKQRGELRVGMQVGYVPFQMVGNQGNVVGFDAELAAMVAKSLNVGLRIIRQNWQELIPSLRDGRTDVIISGMTVTAERNSEVMFTEPLVETGRMFLVHLMNADRFNSLNDLDKQGVFVISVPGGLGELRLREMLPNAAYREFPERSQAVKEVLERRAHAYVDEEFLYPEDVCYQFAVSHERIQGAYVRADSLGCQTGRRALAKLVEQFHPKDQRGWSFGGTKEKMDAGLFLGSSP